MIPAMPTSPQNPIAKPTGTVRKRRTKRAAMETAPISSGVMVSVRTVVLSGLAARIGKQGYETSHHGER